MLVINDSACLNTGPSSLNLHKGAIPSKGVLYANQERYEFGRRFRRGYRVRNLRGRPRCGRVYPRGDSDHPDGRNYGLLRNGLRSVGYQQSSQSVGRYRPDSGRGYNYRYPCRGLLYGPQGRRINRLVPQSNQLRGRGAFLWA